MSFKFNAKSITLLAIVVVTVAGLAAPVDDRVRRNTRLVDAVVPRRIARAVLPVCARHLLCGMVLHDHDINNDNDDDAKGCEATTL